jgi:hypothetical protein
MPMSSPTSVNPQVTDGVAEPQAQTKEDERAEVSKDDNAEEGKPGENDRSS